MCLCLCVYVCYCLSVIYLTWTTNYIVLVVKGKLRSDVLFQMQKALCKFRVVTRAFVSAGEELFCKLIGELAAGERLVAFLSPSLGSSMARLAQLSPLSLGTQTQAVKQEEPLYPAALHSDIQLLPQQAGMAAILATAVVNSE